MKSLPNVTRKIGVSTALTRCNDTAPFQQRLEKENLFGSESFRLQNVLLAETQVSLSNA